MLSKGHLIILATFFGFALVQGCGENEGKSEQSGTRATATSLSTICTEFGQNCLQWDGNPGKCDTNNGCGQCVATGSQCASTTGYEAPCCDGLTCQYRDGYSICVP